MWESDSQAARCPDWRALSALADLDVAVLHAACRRRRFTKGEVVFHEGDPGGAFHLLDKGRVSVHISTPLGEVAIVDVLQAGDTFGEQALVDGVGQRTATVSALDRVETLTLDAAAFDELRRSHPGVDRFLLMVMAGRLRATTQQLLESMYLPGDTRVLRCICRLATVFSSASIPLTQAEIASMTGVTRSTANRLLRQAQADGLITVSRAHLDIVNAAGLRKRAGLRTPST